MKHNPYKIYFLVAGGLFLGIACFLLWGGFEFRLIQKISWLWFWAVYFLAINLTVGCLYLIDKVNSVRRNKITRVPELVLHSLALLGGSPVALISQKLFRHKTSKKSFLLTYWLIVLIQISIIVWALNKYYFAY